MYQSRGIHPKIKMHYFEHMRVFLLSCEFILAYTAIYLQFQNLCECKSERFSNIIYLLIIYSKLENYFEINYALLHYSINSFGKINK